MNIVDIVLLVILAGFILSGFWFGIIHMVGSLVGLLVGAWAAGHYYEALAQWGGAWVGGNMNLARIIAFFVIFVIVNRLFGIVVFLAEKVFKIIAIIPFMKTFNRLLGAAFGLIEGTLVLGLAVYFASRFPYTASFELAMRGSELAKALNNVGLILAPLLPQAVRAIQSVLA
jgi:membrane protein required for colicin V production